MNYDAAITAIYEAAYQPDRWVEALQAICRVTDSRSASLLYLHHGVLDASVTVTHKLAPDLWQEYLDKYAAIDPFFALSSRVPLGVALSDSQMVPDRTELEKLCGDFYSNFMKKYDLHHIGGATLFKSDDCISAIAIQRGREQGPWPDECMVRLTKLTPHLQRAFHIHTEFVRLRAREKTFYLGLERLLIGNFLLDENGTISYSNPLARKILADSPAISVQNNRLCAFFPEESRELKRAIRQSAEYDGCINSPHHCTLGLHHPDQVNPLPVLVTSTFGSGASHFSNDPHARVAVYLSDPDTPCCIDTQALMLIYRVTQAEANVATAIANGGSLANVAQHNQVSIHTIRNQLKSIYRKTNTGRQTELVKLVLSIPHTAVKTD